MGNQQVRQAKLDLLQVPEMENYFVDFDGNIYSTCRQKQPKNSLLTNITVRVRILICESK